MDLLKGKQDSREYESKGGDKKYYDGIIDTIDKKGLSQKPHHNHEEYKTRDPLKRLNKIAKHQ